MSGNDKIIIVSVVIGVIFSAPLMLVAISDKFRYKFETKYVLSMGITAIVRFCGVFVGTYIILDIMRWVLK